jgi:predicted nucleic acid-binding protein
MFGLSPTFAEKFDLMLVSFDTDFDRTDRNRIIPANI